MPTNVFTVTVWKNGNQNNKTGAGYGIRIPKVSLPQFPQSGQIVLQISNTNMPFQCDKLHKKCPEVRSQKIGMYVLQHNLHTLKKTDSIKLYLEEISKNTFRLFHR